MPAQSLRSGMVVELVGTQTLYDSEMNEYGAGTQLRVQNVRRVATGRTDRQPWEIIFEGPAGQEITLEVGDGSVEFTVLG